MEDDEASVKRDISLLRTEQAALRERVKRRLSGALRHAPRATQAAADARMPLLVCSTIWTTSEPLQGTAATTNATSAAVAA